MYHLYWPYPGYKQRLSPSLLSLPHDPKPPASLQWLSSPCFPSCSLRYSLNSNQNNLLNSYSGHVLPVLRALQYWINHGLLNKTQGACMVFDLRSGRTLCCSLCPSSTGLLLFPGHSELQPVSGPLQFFPLPDSSFLRSFHTGSLLLLKSHLRSQLLWEACPRDSVSGAFHMRKKWELVAELRPAPFAMVFPSPGASSEPFFFFLKCS